MLRLTVTERICTSNSLDKWNFGLSAKQSAVQVSVGIYLLGYVSMAQTSEPATLTEVRKWKMVSVQTNPKLVCTFLVFQIGELHRINCCRLLSLVQRRCCLEHYVKGSGQDLAKSWPGSNTPTCSAILPVCFSNAVDDAGFATLKLVGRPVGKPRSRNGSCPRDDDDDDDKRQLCSSSSPSV